MIQFDKKDHKYFERREGEAEYMSVTTLIKKYKEPFDAKKISKNYALKHPEKTAAQWRAEWKKIGKETADYGTIIHAELEIGTQNDPRCKLGSHRINKNTIRSLDMLTDLEDGLYPELLIWSEKWKLAGQADLVEINNGVVDITDYKTYKKVNLKSFYNPKIKQWSCMLHPLNGVQDCNYNHTGLQLAMYGLMMEDLGYKIGKLKLLHIDRNGNKTPYSVPYSQFKMFATFILLDYNKDGNKQKSELSEQS